MNDQLRNLYECTITYSSEPSFRFWQERHPNLHQRKMSFQRWICRSRYDQTNWIMGGKSVAPSIFLHPSFISMIMTKASIGAANGTCESRSKWLVLRDATHRLSSSLCLGHNLLLTVWAAACALDIIWIMCHLIKEHSRSFLPTLLGTLYRLFWMNYEQSKSGYIVPILCI